MVADDTAVGEPKGVSGRLVGPAAFKAVEALYQQRLVGSIPIHSRSLPEYLSRGAARTASSYLAQFRPADFE